MNNILAVRGLCKSYGAFSLKDVSFEIPAGYIMGFIGPNGAGKTTTIKSVLGITGYEGGEVELFGQCGREDAAYRNEHIGIVMDTPFYADDWTAADLEAAVSPFYSRWNPDAYASLLKRFGIDRRKKVKELSRGMKVKIMMAVALSHDPGLLILDEPTSGLDPAARDALCDMLGEFVADENRSVLFSTHITSDLERIADYITLPMAMHRPVSVAQMFPVALGMLVVVSIIEAIQLPMYFKLGYEKAKFMAYLPFMALFLGALVLKPLFSADMPALIESLRGWLAINSRLAALSGLVIWLGAMMLSYRMAVAYYSKRDF